MLRQTAALFLLALAGPIAAQGTCPIQGIKTSDTGTGSGVYSPSELVVSWNASTCSVDLQIQTVTCCNVYLTRHFVGVGKGLLPNPSELGAPFLPGSFLRIKPFHVFGPLPGSTSSIPVPASPGLVGATFAMQAVPVFFTTIGQYKDFATTQAVEVTFL